MRNWVTNIEVLERILKPWRDARGYGESDDYPGDLEFSDFADDLNRVLDYYDGRKLICWGFQWGTNCFFILREIQSSD